MAAKVHVDLREVENCMKNKACPEEILFDKGKKSQQISGKHSKTLLL